MTPINPSEYALGKTTPVSYLRGHQPGLELTARDNIASGNIAQLKSSLMEMSAPCNRVNFTPYIWITAKQPSWAASPKD